MPFGRKASGLTRVFEYGAREPHEGLPVMLDELHRRHHLWNKLVEIDHKFREDTGKIINTELDGQISTFRETASALRKNIKLLRKKAAYTAIEYGLMKHQLEDLLAQYRTIIRGQEPAPHRVPPYKQIPELLYEDPKLLVKLIKEVKAITEAVKPIYEEAKKRRRERIEANRDILDQMDHERYAAVKAAMKESGAHWANSEDVVRSYDEARIRAMKRGVQLHFHSWTAEGKITIRYQHGRSSDDLFNPSDGRLQVAPMDMIAWTGTQAQRRKANHTEVWIRCGSGDKGTPVWVKFTAYIHRPLPQDSSIQGAALIRRKVGLRYEYRLLITVRCRLPEIVARRPSLTVSLDWRRLEDGSLQVASWRDSRRKTGTITIDAGMVGQFDLLERLQARAKKYQNIAAEAIQALKQSGAETSEWFRSATETLAHWESPMRFVRLWREWNENRFDGDKEAFTALDHFRERFLHLYPWQANLRDQLQRHRREIYRIFAADAVRTYGTIHIDDRCLISAGGGQYDNNIRKWTRIAAASVLRNTIKHTAARAGVTVEEVQIETRRETEACGAT